MNTDLALERSSNLIEWIPWTNVHTETPFLMLTDRNAALSPRQFYRAKILSGLIISPPDSVAGYELFGNVETALGGMKAAPSALDSGLPVSATQTMLLAFDHQGGLCSWTMAYRNGTVYSARRLTGVFYSYNRLDTNALISLVTGSNRLDAVLSFTNSSQGTFTATYVEKDYETYTGNFSLQPMPMITLQNGIWSAAVSGTFGRQQHFRITVPEGSHQLAIQTEHAVDAFHRLCDVAVEHQEPAAPTRHRFYVEDEYSGELLTIRNPVAGDWYVMLEDNDDFNDVRLRATYSSAWPDPLILQPSQQTAPSSGSTNQAAIISPAGGTWEVTSEVNWIMVLSPLIGFGDATLVYSVAVNTGTTSRTGALRIGDQVLTVIQEAGQGSGEIAPATIAGYTVTITDSQGHQYAPITYSDGTHFSMPADPFTPATSGTYTYTRTGPSTASVVMDVTSYPMTGRRITVSLIFTTPTTGAFIYNATGGGVADYQMNGSFIAN